MGKYGPEITGGIRLGHIINPVVGMGATGAMYYIATQPINNPLTGSGYSR